MYRRSEFTEFGADGDDRRGDPAGRPAELDGVVGDVERLSHQLVAAQSRTAQWRRQQLLHLRAGVRRRVRKDPQPHHGSVQFRRTGVRVPRNSGWAKSSRKLYKNWC